MNPASFLTAFIFAYLITATVALNFNQPVCGINENYSPCTQLCPPTCENPNPRCRVDCSRGACTCIPGHVYQDGRCIQSSACYQPGRCRSHFDCQRGSSCLDGVCRVASGVYSQTILSSSSSSHRQQSVRNGCSLDVHCAHKHICIDGFCELTSSPSRFSMSCAINNDCPYGMTCLNRICR